MYIILIDIIIYINILKYSLLNKIIFKCIIVWIFILFILNYIIT